MCWADESSSGNLATSTDVMVPGQIEHPTISYNATVIADKDSHTTKEIVKQNFQDQECQTEPNDSDTELENRRTQQLIDEIEWDYCSCSDEVPSMEEDILTQDSKNLILKNIAGTSGKVPDESHEWSVKAATQDNRTSYPEPKATEVLMLSNLKLDSKSPILAHSKNIAGTSGKVLDESHERSVKAATHNNPTTYLEAEATEVLMLNKAFAEDLRALIDAVIDQANTNIKSTRALQAAEKKAMMQAGVAECDNSQNLSPHAESDLCTNWPMISGDKSIQEQAGPSQASPDLNVLSDLAITLEDENDNGTENFVPSNTPIRSEQEPPIPNRLVIRDVKEAALWHLGRFREYVATAYGLTAELRRYRSSQYYLIDSFHSLIRQLQKKRRMRQNRMIEKEAWNVVQKGRAHEGKSKEFFDQLLCFHHEMLTFTDQSASFSDSTKMIRNTSSTDPVAVEASVLIRECSHEVHKLGQALKFLKSEQYAYHGEQRELCFKMQTLQEQMEENNQKYGKMGEPSEEGESSGSQEPDNSGRAAAEVAGTHVDAQTCINCMGDSDDEQDEM